MDFEYRIDEVRKGFLVDIFYDIDKEHSFVAPTWEDVLQYFADFGITPRRPHVKPIESAPLTYKPFEHIGEEVRA